MNDAILHIRTKVLRMNQAELAGIARVSQGTVSKWETGDLSPGLEELARIRAEARKRGLRWNDRWFFEVPAQRQQARAAS